MKSSSYLFMSRRKNEIFSSRAMEKQHNSDSNMSVDSLDEDFNKKASLKDAVSDDNVETILVPFYEKDVLIKVPKDQIRKTKQDKTKFTDKQKKESPVPSSYLVNKDSQRSKRTTYLEMFRKQFVQNRTEKVKTESIRSISPEVGDTERESIGEDQTNPGEEFYNTESYNEIYYEKLLQQQMDELEDSSEEGVLFNDEEGNKSPYDNLRSVSEVSPPHRRSRRATVLPAENVKLGGLGPDLELIKPRLERARSLQRYSEKVRMANRLRIYKKSIQDDNLKKQQERDALAKRDSARRRSARDQHEDKNPSYLVNKSSEDKPSKLINKIYDSKARSANAHKSKERQARKEEHLSKVKSAKGKDVAVKRNRSANRDMRSSNPKKDDKGTENEEVKVRVKSSARSSRIHTEIKPENPEVPPVQISFLVNFGGVRPSTALRSLEEKHRHFQEKVKSYMENKE